MAKGPVGALVLILAVLGALRPAQRIPSLSRFDQLFYLGVAYDLRHSGRFTDGYQFAPAGADGQRPSGMRFGPLYPAVVAGAAALDPRFARAMDCEIASGGRDAGCGRQAVLLRTGQVALLALVFLLIWGIGARIGGRRIGWLALLIALPTAPLLLRAADYVMTEIPTLALTTGASLAALYAVPRARNGHLADTGARRGIAAVAAGGIAAATAGGIAVAAAGGIAAAASRGVAAEPGPAAAASGGASAADADDRPGRWREPPPRSDRPVAAAPGTHRGAGASAWQPLALAGALLGLAALTRPVYLYLIEASLLAAILFVMRHRGLPNRRASAGIGAFLLGAALPIAPWILRNWRLFGRPALSVGYAGHTLAQRLAFDGMTGREYALSYLCWLPDGRGIAALFAGAGACARFGWDERPDTFYAIGMRRIAPQSLAAAGGADRHVAYLLQHTLLPHLGWHLAVSLPLALRGAWIDHYWGLVLAPLALVASIRAARRGPAMFLLLALPAWFMLLLHAAIAVNQPRYNLMLIPVYAVAGALALERAWVRLRPTPAAVGSDGGRGSAGADRPFSSAATGAHPWPHAPLPRRPLAGPGSGSARSNALRRRRDRTAD